MSALPHRPVDWSQLDITPLPGMFVSGREPTQPNSGAPLQGWFGSGAGSGIGGPSYDRVFSGGIIENAYHQELTTDARITRLEKLALAYGQETEFLRALIAMPSDDTLRMAYRDFLLERGREAEAQELLDRRW